MRSKYGNKNPTYNGITFDSKKEMYRYIRLKSMQEEGLISDLRMQVPYEIIPAVYETQEVQLKTKVKTVTKCVQRATYYLADFVYKDKDGTTIPKYYDGDYAVDKMTRLIESFQEKEELIQTILN